MPRENKKLTRAVRERMGRTGESYSTARMHVLASIPPTTGVERPAAAAPPAPTSPPQPAPDLIVVLGYEPEVDDEQLVRVSIPARYGPRPQPHGHVAVVLRDGGVYAWWRTHDGRNTSAWVGRELVADIIKVVWPTPESVPEKWRHRPLKPGGFAPDVLVVVNTPRYRTVLITSENQPLPYYATLERVPPSPGRYVLTGDRTADYPPGPSPSGFVCDPGDVVVGRVGLATGKRPLTVDEIKRRHPDWTFHQLSFGLWKHRGGYASVEERQGGWYASLAQAMGPRDEHGRFPQGELPRGPFATPEEAIAAAGESGWTIVTQGV